MTARVQDNLMKGTLILILFIILMLQSVLGSAQSFRESASGSYKGFVVDFGARTATVSSSIEKIHQSALLQAGGQVGVIFGNGIVRSKIGLLGYYSSTEMSSGTTDLYTSNVAVNFYPLACLTGNSLMIEPYITGSVDYNQYKFFGYYLNREPGTINYSQANAPYLGKIKQVNATVGLGIELKLNDEFDFIHLFSEVRYGYNLTSKATDAAFSGTAIKNQTSVAVGVTFGMHR